MKRKCDGWISGEFHYLERIARHSPENDPEFDKKIQRVVDALKGKLRPGRLTTKGKPCADTKACRWLCDVCNYAYSGRWTGMDISEGHLNKIAELLKWPELWGTSGDISYCVNSDDYYDIEHEMIHCDPLNPPIKARWR